MIFINYGNKLTLPDEKTLSIPHIHLELNERNRVVMQLESGWVFYDKREYPEGTPDKDISYYSYAVYPPDYDFTNIIVVDEATVQGMIV